MNSTYQLNQILSYEDRMIKRSSKHIKMDTHQLKSTDQPTKVQVSQILTPVAIYSRQRQNFSRDHSLGQIMHQNKLKNTPESLVQLRSKDEYQIWNELKNRLLNFQKIADTISKGTAPEIEVQKLYRAINDLSDGMDKASQVEVELGITRRDLQRCLQTSQGLTEQVKLLKLQVQEQEEMNKRLKKQNEELALQTSHLKHDHLSEVKVNHESKLKIEALEQRLELLLESDFPQSAENQIKLRKSLTHLVKEVEIFKREAQQKAQEIERLQEQLRSKTLQIQKLTQKIEFMKKKISIKDMEWINNEEKALIKNNQVFGSMASIDEALRNDPTTVMARVDLFETLDFRINSLRSEFANIVHEISEKGSSAYAQRVLDLQNIKQQKEHIALVTSQYLSFKDNAEKFNTMMKYTIALLSCETLNEKLAFIATNYKNIFMCERCHLWILDAMNGILTTLNDSNEILRGLMNKGIFGEVVRLQKPLHKREGMKSLYTETQNGKTIVKTSTGSIVRVNQTLCYPIFGGNNQVLGLLEISNSFSDQFSFDEEYYGLILAKFCEEIIKIQQKEDVLKIGRQTDAQIQKSFWAVSQSQNLQNLYFQIRKAFFLVLAISQIAIYFVKSETQQIFTFKNTNSQVENYETVYFNWDQGIAGQVRQRSKSLIVVDIKKCPDYDMLVDLSSLLPIYAVPIISKEENKQVLAIVEMPLKSKVRAIDMKESLLRDKTPIQTDETFEQVANRMCECFQESLIFFLSLQKNMTL